MLGARVRWTSIALVICLASILPSNDCSHTIMQLGRAGPISGSRDGLVS